MNWQAWPQRLGSLLREMPQSVHNVRGAASATGAAQTGAVDEVVPVHGKVGKVAPISGTAGKVVPGAVEAVTPDAVTVATGVAVTRVSGTATAEAGAQGSPGALRVPPAAP